MAHFSYSFVTSRLDAYNVLLLVPYGVLVIEFEAARQWLDKRHTRLNHFINGSWVGPSSASYFEARSEADSEVLAMVADGTAKDTDRAVLAAQSAQPAWAALGSRQRADFLAAVSMQVSGDAQTLLELESLSGGHSDSDSRAQSLADQLQQHARRLLDATGEPAESEPQGVTALINQAQVPLLGAIATLTPALVAGDTVVFKPAGFSSCTAVLWAQACAAAQLPKGVFNLLLGGEKAASLLASHPDVGKFASAG